MLDHGLKRYAERTCGTQDSLQRGLHGGNSSEIFANNNTEVSTVITVQRLRGFNPKKFGSGIIRTSLNILTPTLANCVRRTGTLAVSIQSRAFRANPDRTYLKKLKFSDLDKVVVTVFVITAISIVIIKLLYNMYTSGICYTSGLRPVYAIARGYL